MSSNVERIPRKRTRPVSGRARIERDLRTRRKVVRGRKWDGRLVTGAGEP